jgi:outer membrane protein TolC
MINNFIPETDSTAAYTATEYSSTLINVTLRQPLVKYNSYRWERKIEPMLYNEAKKIYLESMEQVALEATNHFFSLLLAQIEQRIAIINEANYDTLYKIAQGRYELGKIAENELLQLELQYLTSGADVKNAKLQVDDQMYKFKSFLRIQDDIKIELIEPSDINQFAVNANKALEEARYNSSESLSFSRQLIEAESQVAEAKYDGRFDAELFAVYGLSNVESNIRDLNKRPQDIQSVELGVTIPILDWGVARGKLKMAQSNQEIVRTNVEQQQIDFDQKVFLLVSQFNMQYDQVTIAAKSDTVGQKRYDITKARYLIGKISITDLNIAQTEADNSRKSYFNSLWRYWRYYYELRKLSLYDFERNLPIMVDYKELL